MQASTVEPVETGAIVTQAQTLTIASHADNEAAGRFMVECKALRQKVCDNYDPAIEAAHHAHKAMLAAKNEHIKPIDDAMNMVKVKVKWFLVQQEIERQAEQARLEAEAQKAAEAVRAAEVAEAKRLADIAKAERDRLQAMANAAGEQERAAANAALKAAEDARKLAAAAVRTVKAAPVVMAAPVVVAAAPKVAGVSTKKRWTAQIVNADLVPRKFLTLDMTAINRVVTALGAMHDIPGVKAVEVTDVVVRK